MKTILVVYDPKDGDCVPDGQVKDYVDNALAKIFPNIEVLHRTIVGSELIINEFRIRHMYGEVDVTFEFNGANLKPQPSGRLDSWPEGFCGTWDRQLRSLLDGRFKK